MMPEKYTFIVDPSGDVVLTLSNPDAPFAVWEESGVGKIDEKTSQLESDPHPAGDRRHPAPSPSSAPGPAPEVVTFLLSSRHLSLASLVFKTMLSGGWMEGVKGDSGNPYQLTAESWNTEALATVMNIIHGRWSLVPTAVSLEMLANIAVIVDYYDIHELVRLISSLWMKHFVAPSIPTLLCRELVLWILISWFFKDEALFRQATKVAILRSKHELDIPSDIPIPASIITEINTRRRESIKDIADGLRELIRGHTAGRYGCDFECSCMRLGALMKGLHDLKFVYESPPDAPFGGSSLVDVVEKLRTMKSPAWRSVSKACAGCRSRGYSYPRCSNCAGAHACFQSPLAFGLQEVQLGVDEAAFTSVLTGDSELGQYSQRLVQKLEGNVAMDLGKF